MNYQKIYNDIIQIAKSQKRLKLRKNDINYVYYENHHILPRCLGGTDAKENLVLLTAKEHYVCHKLLTYIYKENRKIALAFHKMTYGNTIKDKNCKISSRDYEYARKLISFIPVSIETKHKQSESHKGILHTKESKEKISLSKIGIPRSEETKKKCRDSQIGRSKTFSKELIKEQSNRRKEYNTKNKKGKTYEEQYIKIYGKELGIIKAKEQKIKLSKSKKGKPRNKKVCPYCNREIAEGNYGKYHGDKCKYKL